MPTPEALLPSRQHRYRGLPVLSEQALHLRRERLFLLLAGLFLGTLAMLNIIGITRFVTLGSVDAGSLGRLTFMVAVGVLPYPLTFLCTDFISELYGRQRANQVVWVGLLVNLWVLAMLWLGGAMPVRPEMIDVAGGQLPLTPPTYETVDGVTRVSDPDAWTFYRVRMLTFGAVAASMAAYLAAQFADVYLFHFWKRVTKGRALWVRNNGSTMISQLIDTTAVILITHFYAHALPIDADRPLALQLTLFIVTGYAFKFVIAALDTVPFCLLTPVLARYLRLPQPGDDPAADGGSPPDPDEPRA